MRKFRIALSSLFIALLCMTTAASAQGQTIVDDLVAKSKRHHHHHRSDSSSSDSSSSSSSSSSSEHIRRGHRGHRGKKGPQGHRGRRGRRGTAITGQTGPIGPTGPVGIPGTQGGAITSFISAFEVAGGTVVPLGTNILWSTPPPPATQHIVDQTGDFSLNGTGVFTSTAGAGNYEVFYGALWSGAAPFQLFVNGVAVPGSILNPPNDDFASMSIIVNVGNATPTFEIRNISGTTAANLNPGATNLTTGAFITIKKIS